MKLFRSGSYAAVASTAALVVALGGTSYAAGQMTSSADGASKATVPAAKQVFNNNGTAVTNSAKTVLTMHLTPGNWMVFSKATAYYSGSSPYVYCELTGPGGNTVDSGAWYDPNYGYSNVANQAAFHLKHNVTVQLNCSGQNVSLYNKKIDAFQVPSLSNVLGSNVSKVAAPQPTR
jgi:hypothetical protein